MWSTRFGYICRTKKRVKCFNLYVTSNEKYITLAHGSITTDKPSRPEGPLLAKVADQESVTLDWQPPTDDGGCDVAGYFIEKFDSKKQSWTKVTCRSQLGESSVTSFYLVVWRGF